MAIAIKSIPVLKNNVAKNFAKKAKESLALKGTIDFSAQKESARRILGKAKMK